MTVEVGGREGNLPVPGKVSNIGFFSFCNVCFTDALFNFSFASSVYLSLECQQILCEGIPCSMVITKWISG